MSRMSRYKTGHATGESSRKHQSQSQYTVKYIIAGVLMVMLAGILIWSLLRPEAPEEVVPEELLEYPHEMTLTDLEGRSLDVIIIARNEDTVQFDRVIDNARFKWPIANLIEENREIILRLPNTGLIENPAGRITIAALNSGSKPSESWVDQRRNVIRRLQHDIAQLHYQQAIATDRAHRQALGREIELKQREIMRIEKTIHDYLNRPR